MDLIAAFLFATVILPHFQKKETEERGPLLKKIFFSSLIAASLLFFTYVGLCLISAYHLGNTSYPSEQLLRILATKLLGPMGGSYCSYCCYHCLPNNSDNINIDLC